MPCDSDTATVRAAQDTFDMLQDILHTGFDAGGMSFRIFQRVARNCMGLTLTIRPAALRTMRCLRDSRSWRSQALVALT